MRVRHGAGALLLGLLSLTACTDSAEISDQPTNATSAPAPGSATAGPPAAATSAPRPTGTASSPSPEITEPTTTNTLPPPPRPSRAAPSTAGKLSAASLPVPTGWRTVARKGSSEEGYQGNGTWVHARDPRYAAHDVVTLGCTEVTRDDYPDPVAALEGTYKTKKGGAGVGLVLQFSNQQRARTFFEVYLKQIRACNQPNGPVLIKVIPSSAGLIDQRTDPADPTNDWTEVGLLKDQRVTLVVLTDQGHKRSRTQSERLLSQIPNG